MLWNKIKNRNVFNDGLTKAEAGLREKDEKWLHIAYGAFASNAPELICRAGRAVRNLLKDYNMSKMIRLSETFRQYTSMEWYIDWNAIQPGNLKRWFESEEDYRYAMILGSFHPNGYYREKCLHELVNCKNALPFILLRMNDWVEEIRQFAEAAACRMIQSCPVEDLFYAMPAMDKVRRSGRRREKDISRAEQLLIMRLEQEAGSISVREVLGFDFEIRKCVYRFLFSGRILGMEQAEQFLEKEKHSFCQSVIITGIFKYYHCPMEQIDRYLKHKNSCVRRKALEYKYGIVKNTWSGLDSMLLDSSHGIREFVVFILERYEDFDTLGYYLKHLDDEDPVIPIIEIGNRGEIRLTDILMPFLKHPREKVVRSALTATGKLAGAEMRDVFWTYLFDPRPSVSKAAYLAAVKNNMSYGADVLYEAILHSPSDRTKRYLVNLLIHEKSWERIPFLIRLYSNSDMEILRSEILSGLWGRNLYCRITNAQGQAVIQALEECGACLPGQVVREILFDLKFVMKG